MLPLNIVDLCLFLMVPLHRYYLLQSYWFLFYSCLYTKVERKSDANSFGSSRLVFVCFICCSGLVWVDNCFLLCSFCPCFLSSVATYYIVLVFLSPVSSLVLEVICRCRLRSILSLSRLAYLFSFALVCYLLVQVVRWLGRVGGNLFL